MTMLAAARGLFYRLADAAPVAWREDQLFRSAVIGAGITLAVFLVRPGVSQPGRQLPPLDTLSTGMPAVLSPVGRGMVVPTQMPPAEVPKIAPGHSLGDVMVVPTPGNDRFGTFKPGKHPRSAPPCSCQPLCWLCPWLGVRSPHRRQRRHLPQPRQVSSIVSKASSTRYCVGSGSPVYSPLELLRAR